MVQQNKQKMATETASDSIVKHKAISGCLTEYFDFKVSSDGTISRIKHLANLPLTTCASDPVSGSTG